MAVAEEGQSLSKGSKRWLRRAVGNSDPSLPHRMAQRLGPGQLAAAFYADDRVARLVSLDAAYECRDDPFYLAPSLAALMGAEDRQVASRAAHALRGIVSRADGQADGYAEVVPGQAAQLREQLATLSRDPRLDLDIRTTAMAAIRSLEQALSLPKEDWISPLLKDPELTIRARAMGHLTPPLEDGMVSVVAKMVTEDAEPAIRGQAAALLCENALAHDVDDPSQDLTAVLKDVLQTRGLPIEAIGGILSCLSGFKGENTSSLLDIALAHPDPAVKDFWKSVSK